jgi:tetratricopeptide (TPR) repeat protein
MIRCRWPLTVLTVALAFTIIAPAAGPRAPGIEQTDPAPPPNTDAQPLPKKLSLADVQFLEGLLKDFLFDPPKEAKRVRFKAPAHIPGESQLEQVDREGWLVPSSKGEPARVYFTDGESLAAPKEFIDVDFITACRRRYPADRTPDRFARFGVGGRASRRSAPIVDGPHLANAAWLYRLGERALAARALAWAKALDPTPVESLRRRLATRAYACAVDAFSACADAEALTHLERLFRLYPTEAKENHPQARILAADLARRRLAGTFGKGRPAALPQGGRSGTNAQRIASLIASLDEVDVGSLHPWGLSGPTADPRVRELEALGETAVPALVEVVEKDMRLTRSITERGLRGWTDRRILGVREVALQAAQRILRVKLSEPDLRPAAEERAWSTGLREYWDRYGQLPFASRMLAMLRDPVCPSELTTQAAANLADLGWQCADDRIVGPTGQFTSLNPVVFRFRDPTAAEAMLTALDRACGSLTEIDPEHRGVYEDRFLLALVQLGDRRVLPELARRCAAADDPSLQRKWAMTSFRLGDPWPLRILAEEVRAGRHRLSAGGVGDERAELDALVSTFTEAGTAECDQALWSIARPTHPYYEMAVEQVLTRSPWRTPGWFNHPFCLAVLRQQLDDMTPTGGFYKLDGMNAQYQSAGGDVTSRGIAELRTNPAACCAEAAERVCDLAANRLREVTLGLPICHPLLKESEQRLRALRKALDCFAERFQRVPPEVAGAFGASNRERLYVPMFEPLGRSATSADVRAGRAVFDFAGKGRLAAQSLPAVGLRKASANDEAEPVLIVQAECSPAGELVFGVIGFHRIRALPASQVEKIKPFQGAK